MKVLITEKIHPEGIRILEEDAQVSCNFSITRKGLLEVIGDYDALIVRNMLPIDRKVLVRAEKLKVVGMAGIGLDHIDQDFCREKGIAVCNVPDGSIDSVAELAWGLVLALARKIIPAYQSVRQGKWDKHSFVGLQLRGKTLGIVGLGKIGSRVAVFGQAFGMEVVAHDPYLSHREAEERGIKLETLEGLLGVADIVTIHCPLTSETCNLFSKETIGGMKTGAILVNLSRGPVCDEEGVYEALEKGKLGAFGTDVTAQEPPDPKLKLLHADKVVVTPHIGAATQEAQAYIARTIAGKVLDVLFPEKRKEGVT